LTVSIPAPFVYGKQAFELRLPAVFRTVTLGATLVLSLAGKVRGRKPSVGRIVPFCVGEEEDLHLRSPGSKGGTATNVVTLSLIHI